MANKTALTIIISIILTVLLVSTVNVGLSLFFERPEDNDYCGDAYPVQKINEQNQTYCEQTNGTWGNQWCDYYGECRKEYGTARENYNQDRFYILAIIGFLLLLLGLFTKENLIQLTSLTTGGILVLEGIVINLENKLIMFLSLILILAIFGILAGRIIKRKE
jgi:hypothetical protein